MSPDIASGQRAAESLMTDTFAAYAPGGRTAQDEGTGLEVPVLDARGSTPGKIQGPSQQSSDTNTRTETIGGVPVEVISGGLHIPVSSPKPEIGWEYQCTAVGPRSPAALLNTRYRVVNVPLKSWMTAYRLDVVQIPNVIEVGAG